MSKKDRIIFFNISAPIEKASRGAIERGLKNVRSYLRVHTPVEMLVLYDPSQKEKDFSSDGGALGRNTIFLNVNIKRKFSAARLRQFESSTVHEYVHALRYGIKIPSLLDALINEGISCFIQTSLYGPPNYLDPKGTHIGDINKWWRWWHKRYLTKPNSAQSSGDFLDYWGTREGGYRMGYYIVSSYVDAKNLSPRQLLNIPFGPINKFAHQLFRKSRKKIKKFH